MANNINSIIEKLVEERKPLTEFEDFFSLPDGEKVMGFFQHDKFGKETTDLKKRSKKIPFIQRQTKQAATTDDFELIYQREMEKQKSNDNSNFKRWIIKKISEMKNVQQSLPADIDKISLDLQNLSDNFLKWVDYRNREETEKTLQTIFDSNELAKLRKALLKEKYIAVIRENDFVYWLSGNSLNSMAKIKWIKTRGRKQLAYLLAGTIKNKNGICINFNFSTANKCFELIGNKLDSNDRPKSGYKEIDEILKTLRPILATP